MAKFRTHYDNLKVARNAPDAVIRAAYKALMQKYHPDKYDGDPKEAERIAKVIQASFNILSDPVKRAEHDEWIRQQERREKEEQEFQEVNDGPQEKPFNTGDAGYESWHYQSAPKNDSPKDSHANQPPPPDSPPSPSPANPLDARLPILRPAFSWAFWIFLLTLGTFRKPPSSPYGVNYFLTAMATAIMSALIIFGIVALVQGIRRALGHAPSKSKVPYISDWFTHFESVTDAEGALKVSFFVILAYEAIIVAIEWKANYLSTGTIEHFATAGLAWWCYRRPSLVPAFILVALSLMVVVATGINKFGGGEGGQNLFMAIFIALISVQVWRAVSYIKKNTQHSTGEEPAVSTQYPNWFEWSIAVAIGVAIVIPFLDEQKKNPVAYEVNTEANKEKLNAQSAVSEPAQSTTDQTAAYPSQFKGEKMSLNAQNIPLKSAFKLLGDFAGLKMEIADSVATNIDVNFNNAPWDYIFSYLIMGHNLLWRQQQDGSVFVWSNADIGNSNTVVPSAELVKNTSFPATSTDQPAGMEYLLDINTATAEEIALVMIGVGKNKAEAIVKDREANGKFTSVDDLARVNVIGRATVERNRAKLTAR